MIYLSPPYYQYQGITILRDHLDPLQFYYLPNRPHLARDERGRPAIRFLVYRESLDDAAASDDSVAGFLVFDTSLAWPEGLRRAAAGKLRQDLDLDGEPRLVPLLYKSGSVRLTFLDRTTAAPADAKAAGSKAADANQGARAPAEAAAAEARWVPFLESSGIPSLYGENRAIFSAMLSSRAAKLLFGAFEGFIPAGVTYELRFVGLQRAFHVHVTADWKKAYDYLAQKLGASYFFVHVDVGSIVSELEERKIIRLEASLEGVGEEGLESEFQAVRSELQAFVLQSFFKPQPSPMSPAEGMKQDASDGKKKGDDDGSGGGLLSLSYSRRELHEEEIRSLDIDYTVARAVERTIAPQAHISLFFEDEKLTRDDVVTVVDGGDDLFRHIDFMVAANADFDGDHLFGVHVDVAYGAPGPDGQPDPNGRIWSFLLTKDQAAAKRAAWYDPAVGLSFQYRYSVVFAPSALPGPSRSLDSGWIRATGSGVVVTPGDLYRRRDARFQIVPTFPFDRFSSVRVELRYRDPESGFTHEAAGRIDAEHRAYETAFLVAARATRDIEYRLIYAGAAGPLEAPWQPASADDIDVPDPRPNVQTIDVLPVGDRSKVAQILVDLRYADPEHGVLEKGRIRIAGAKLDAPYSWSFAPVDPKRTRYEHSQTIVDTDGDVLTTGFVEESATTLLVGAGPARMWSVRPELVGPALAANGVERIDLLLRYHDEGNGYDATKDLAFAAPGKGETWRLALKDPSIREYTYEVVYSLRSGFERRVGPLLSSATFLAISSVPPAA